MNEVSIKEDMEELPRGYEKNRERTKKLKWFYITNKLYNIYFTFHICMQQEGL